MPGGSGALQEASFVPLCLVFPHIDDVVPYAVHQDRLSLTAVAHPHAADGHLRHYFSFENS